VFLGADDIPGDLAERSDTFTRSFETDADSTNLSMRLSTKFASVRKRAISETSVRERGHCCRLTTNCPEWDSVSGVDYAPAAQKKDGFVTGERLSQPGTIRTRLGINVLPSSVLFNSGRKTSPLERR